MTELDESSHEAAPEVAATTTAYQTLTRLRDGSLGCRPHQCCVFREDSACITWLPGFPLRETLAENIVRDFDLQQALLHVELNHVAVADRGDRTIECGFRGYVAGHESACGAAEASICQQSYRSAESFS